MLTDLIRTNFATIDDPARIVLVFFFFSHIGYILECIVLTAEQKRLVINRGFTRHLPFCIIYGFGAVIGMPLLSQFEYNLPLLFIVSALGASLFELVTARIQIRLFGDFWWDYSNKPFNIQGILCLESTIGWGFAGIVVTKYLYAIVTWVIGLISPRFVAPLAILLLAIYLIDFLISARTSYRNKNAEDEVAVETYFDA